MRITAIGTIQVEAFSNPLWVRVSFDDFPSRSVELQPDFPRRADAAVRRSAA